MNKTVFIGSVISSKIALETLIESNVKVDLVCSLDEEVSTNVSDYYPIHKIAFEYDIPFLKFKKINSREVLDEIKKIAPDFIYVIGLSQILSNELLDMANKYSIGFHPTPLPKHRGRAAIPWQIILGERESKVSLFKLDQGMDSGDIINQYPYTIEETDYAMDVYHKICTAMSEAIKESVENIYSDSVTFKKQDHEKASFLLVRRPEDGEIDWNLPSEEIETLIRATSKPYPGAFSHYKGNKVVFWKAYLEANEKYIGIPGQIAWKKDNGDIGIIAKDALLVLTKYEVSNDSNPFIIGHKFV
ncbi:methionyl-tRNA formyltransferase [Sporosarcina trichiuri]|uniref:methionyl-tRNA formyltransferase n=1 Tax=Sporosarcina trichiuri TaxID=3056445 RepID=UPI0025B4616B|nr:formyltransferase family protein [Sporosarcina sp. 0.2-SM1T-5]WJY26422.1 formyltransferase family protein [Sporosarcina sp. 0.2-SM1T-5]